MSCLTFQDRPPKFRLSHRRRHVSVSSPPFTFLGRRPERRRRRLQRTRPRAFLGDEIIIYRVMINDVCSRRVINNGVSRILSLGSYSFHFRLAPPSRELHPATDRPCLLRGRSGRRIRLAAG